jgi:hypothetical protein
MTFSDLSQSLLSIKNCSLTINTDFGEEYFQDLHKTVRDWMKTVKQTKNPKESTQCLMLKERLQFIHDNFDNLQRGFVGAKRKR